MNAYVFKPINSPLLAQTRTLFKKYWKSASVLAMIRYHKLFVLSRCCCLSCWLVDGCVYWTVYIVSANLWQKMTKLRGWVDQNIFRYLRLLKTLDMILPILLEMEHSQCSTYHLITLMLWPKATVSSNSISKHQIHNIFTCYELYACAIIVISYRKRRETPYFGCIHRILKHALPH